MSRSTTTPLTLLRSAPGYGLGFDGLPGLAAPGTAWSWYSAKALNSCIRSISGSEAPDLKLAA